MTRACGSVVEARGSFGFLPLPPLSSSSWRLRLISASAALRGLHARAALARRPLLGSPDALIAGLRIGVGLALELFHHRLRQGQMPVERRLAPERASAGIRPYPHAVLRQRLEIDKPSLGQRRKMLAEQPVEQIGATHPEVRQRVIVHRHAAAQPAIDVISSAQPRQRPGAADPIAGGVEPKPQQKPRRGQPDDQACARAP